ncbi:hypothetical protein J5N97_014965 [Dioscorea zingiberensis]|uniref:Uncharacterized protein n=1 Tax=Dioscorea zingiberensis TaxID=325984 RepID=A0A9D5CTC7_9LILI|nr:hypothetical protein J5N97_014965 [Dioscorea zingiberensis]
MGENPWAIGEEAMEGMASLWGYQESVEDLKQKLFCTTLEIESLRNNAKEEMRKSEETINQLILLLKITSQERDEARDQLQILLNKITQPSPVNNVSPLTAYLQHETQQMMQIRGNSSVTESDSLSETPKQHQSVDSFFDTVPSSPDLSNMNMGDSGNAGSQQLLLDYNTSVSMTAPKPDKASVIVDGLVSSKNMPENGKFLQAVMEAGPLLQTLLVAGPLPRWRNPPPLQPFQIPPVSVKHCNAPQLLKQTAPVNPNYVQVCSSPTILSFGSCLKKRSSLPSCGISYQNLAAKKQKSQ